MSEDKAKILVIDDEKFFIDVMVELLNGDYKVSVAMDGEQGLRRAQAEPRPDLILLDVLMPGMNGYDVCRELKDNHDTCDIPVIFLTAKGAEADEIKGLELGASDFIKKPISPQKLIARVNSNLRKGAREEKNLPVKINIGPLRIDRDKYVVHIDGTETVLPRKEFELLYFLANNPGKVFSRDALLRTVWGTDVYVVDRTVDVHVRKIREKLDQYSDLIETIKGVGYRFKSVE